MSHSLVVHVASVALQTAAAAWFAVFVFRVHRRPSWVIAATLLLGVSVWHAGGLVESFRFGDHMPLDLARDVLYPLTFGVFLVAAVRLGPVFESLVRAEREAKTQAYLRQRYLDVVDGVIITLDPVGRVTLVNRCGCDVLCRDEEQLVGAGWFAQMVPEDERDVAWACFERILSGVDHDVVREQDVLRPDGERRTVRWHWAAIEGEDGRVARVLGAGEDVTERRRMERVLELDGHLLETTVDAIAVVESDGTLCYVNDAACRLLGHSREDLLRLDPLAWVAPESDSDLGELEETLHAEGPHAFEMTLLVREGDRVPVEVHSHVFRHEGRDVVVAIMRDISERKVAEETITRLALHDNLTGLPNRRLLEQRLSDDIAADPTGAQGVGVFVLDADRFKAVNELHGHDAGDRLLIAVATRLLGVVREGDVVGRMGGDEFLLLLHGVSSRDAAEHAVARVREALRAPFELGVGDAVPCSFSMGVALRTGPDDTAEWLLRGADAAMHQVKASGRDGHRFYDPGTHEETLGRHQLARDLRSAVSRGEIEVRYQPIVSAEDGRIVAAEALARWRHPVRGLVPPSVFIPLAEETGVILEIGEWILETACRACSDWRRSGHLGLRVAVNISPTQLVDPGLVNAVLDRLALSGLEPSALELEITETVALSETAVVGDAFARLRAIGVRLAIDDFGTGHSSLERLKRLPIDTLKIDKTFVDDLGGGAEAVAITRAILALGADLGLAVVAEGVERPEQAEYLRAAGCPELQGYHFSRPLTRRRFERALRREGQPESRAAG